MSEQYFSKKINLQAEEELIAVLHHHPLTYAKQIAIVCLLIFGAFFFMFFLFSLGEIGVAMFCALLITGVFYGGREFYIWYNNACILTSQRLVDIDQQGFFHKTVSDIVFEKILDISYSVRGFWQTVLKLGTIKIQATGANLILKNIKEAGKINQLIADLIKKQTGNKIEVKRVVNLSPEVKNKITDDFLNQDELAKYEDYKLAELLEEYKDTYGELSLKKMLVEELEAKDKQNKQPEPAADEDIAANFKKKQL